MKALKLPARFEREVRAFLTTPHSAFTSNTHCESRNTIKAYMRLVTRLNPVTSERIQCIDMASIDVAPEKQRRGLYSAFLALLDDLAGERMIYIENVHEPEHASIYERRGYTQIVQRDWLAHMRIKDIQFPAHFYKLPKEKQDDQN